VKHTNVRAKVGQQATPRHDFMDFKTMHGNEILLNLENHENLANSELVGGLLELANRRVSDQTLAKIGLWEENSTVYACLEDLHNRAPALNSRNLLQSVFLLDRFGVGDPHIWQTHAKHVLRMLHKFKGRDLAKLLSYFGKEFEQRGDMTNRRYIPKAPDELFERIVAILPIHVAHMKADDIVIALEVMADKNLGSERLYNNYIYLQLERHVWALHPFMYARLIKALAQREFYQDQIFWKEYILKYMKTDRKGINKREFTRIQALEVWLALVFLRIRCPSINVTDEL